MGWDFCSWDFCWIKFVKINTGIVHMRKARINMEIEVLCLMKFYGILMNEASFTRLLGESVGTSPIGDQKP